MSTAHDSDSVTWMITIGATLGSTWRNITSARRWPVEVAARTNSTSRSDSTGPRATRVKIGT